MTQLQLREVLACQRCREGKRKCDKARPECGRCARNGAFCVYNDRSQRVQDLQDSDHSSDPITENSSASPMDESSASNRERTIRKRARACLSCSRCHRLKIKCDRRRPCNRCVRSGCGTTCIFTTTTPFKQSPQSPLPSFVLSAEDPEFVVKTWFLRKRGSSHWKALFNRLEGVANLDTSLFALAIEEHISGDCSSDLIIHGNFPFGSEKSAAYASLHKVKELLDASREESEHYLAKYFLNYHPLLALFDENIFRRGVSQYRDTFEVVDASWLALYLVILGIGAYAVHQDDKKAAEFFYASEACLAKTPYMYRSTTTNISTLCLMVIAKQISYATCWALDASWNIMGVIVRLSMMMVLQLEWMPELNDPVIIEERRMRRRLWASVVYLDLQMSLITGQQSLLPQEALLSTFSLEDQQYIRAEDCWDQVLPQSFPIIGHFLARINSTNDQITYNEVLQYDAEIRESMRLVKCFECNEVVRVGLDIFFRRVLLVLHRKHALSENAQYQHPVSYWSSLECSLAMMVHHRNLCDSKDNQDMNLRGRPYMLDFFAAALTCGIHLSPADAALAAPPPAEGRIPPRKTMLDTLTSCLEIFSRERSRSLCFRTGHRLLKLVFEHLPKT